MFGLAHIIKEEQLKLSSNWPVRKHWWIFFKSSIIKKQIEGSSGFLWVCNTYIHLYPFRIRGYFPATFCQFYQYKKLPGGLFLFLSVTDIWHWHCQTAFMLLSSPSQLFTLAVDGRADRLVYEIYDHCLQNSKSLSSHQFWQYSKLSRIVLHVNAAKL